MLFLYSKDNCPACLQLENLLKIKAKTPYKVKKLDIDYTRKTLENLFAGLGTPVPRSFPILFNEGVCIGGLNEGKLAIVRGEI